MGDKYHGEQLTLFDIKLPANSTEEIETVIESNQVESTAKVSQKLSNEKISMAKVPDEEFGYAPLKKTRNSNDKRNH